jgi:hypothetical protein
VDGVSAKLLLIQRDRRTGDVIVPLPDRRLIFPFGVKLPLVDTLEGLAVKQDDVELYGAYATVEITSRVGL